MAFTEFCCRSGGSNLNAGTRTGSSTEPGVAADLTYASGSWVAATGVFTVASGNPASDGVAVGDFASVYADGSTVTGFVGRVTARDATTITVSLSAMWGAAPSNGSNNRTLKIGGAWQGPNGSSGFPWTIFTSGNLTNSSSDNTRVNFKNDQTYSITAVITGISAGAQNFTYFQGYTATYGDGGRATIDGGTSGAAYKLLNVNYNYCLHADFIFQNNGASSSDDLVFTATSNGAGNTFFRCVFKGSRGNGLNLNEVGSAVECEAYGNNLSNSGSLAGFNTGGNHGSCYIRCIAHDNTGSNTSGFNTTSFTTFIDCIADTNGKVGFTSANGNNGIWIKNCDAYNNGSHGIQFGLNSRPAVLENCNLVKNGGYGISGTNGRSPVLILNCGFGSGTQANTSGTVNLVNGSSIQSGTVTYAADVTPWVDPANGDFRINLAAAKGAGRGAFTETATSYSGTVGYPDIGAAQHLETAGIAGPIIGSPFIRGAGRVG